jgi:AcrR family transcriptional regulator
MKTARRPYRMQARAAAAEATTERILAATFDLYRERWFDQVTLADIAERAGVTVPTVLRRFESKGALLHAAARRVAPNRAREREAPPAGDVAAIVGMVVDEYETWGSEILKWLHQEDRVPELKAMAEEGRRFHADWVARAFSPWLDRHDGAARERLHAQLITATDIYVWSLLRHTRGLSRADTERCMRELIEGLERS